MGETILKSFYKFLHCHSLQIIFETKQNKTTNKKTVFSQALSTKSKFFFKKWETRENNHLNYK